VPLAGSWADLVRSVFARECAHLPHLRYPLAGLTAWLGRPPFEAVFNYTDFRPLAELGRQAGFRVLDVWFSDRTDFPLAVDITRGPALQVRAGPGVPAESAADFADLMLRGLAAAVDAPDGPAR
jgi:hypothetical protein